MSSIPIPINTILRTPGTIGPVSYSPHKATEIMLRLVPKGSHDIGDPVASEPRSLVTVGPVLRLNGACHLFSCFEDIEVAGCWCIGDGTCDT
ncbi:hypothetical protein GLAREA_04761 [Glarea lozoyensis ATCC 20868]|uniref:Uncharacterized protein n=1 Tax=Glarea lozoyensis (strain ATCC 20868 / MF5171) TaxID=1116229 RepID=S3CQK1_GLAL2|nr:uncharacterized protein GLAREA_04761 [Glarea lozoyensis ATCC 20868]EPE27970.1 hypothetical protein GLAREA_04761 [Glarea lozoyensis ATCC 20868]